MTFKLQRADIVGEAQAAWVLTFPGCGSRPLVIADGNMQQLFAAFTEQGGTLAAADPDPPSDTPLFSEGDR